MKQKMTGVVHKVTLEQLKEQARAIADVPEHYALEIEDFMQNEAKPESGEAMFVWSDPETGEGILVTLGKNGDLIDLTVDREGEENTTVRLLPLSERQKRAEQFMTKHYPEALKLFHLTHTNEKRGAVQFTYEQKVMGLPLPHSGCDVKVNDSGDIVGFPITVRNRRQTFRQNSFPKRACGNTWRTVSTSGCKSLVCTKRYTRGVTGNGDSCMNLSRAWSRSGLMTGSR